MSKYCSRCGKSIEEGQICSCIAAEAAKRGVPSGGLTGLFNRMGIGDPSTNADDWYERGKQITPDCLKLNDGEVPVKQYDIAVLRTIYKFTRAEGRMQVTNKRLLFRATGRSLLGRTTVQNEFAIDEIAGIGVRRDSRFLLSFFLIGMFLISLFGGASMYMTMSAYARAQTVTAILGVLIGFCCIAPFFLLYKLFWLKLICVSFGWGIVSTLMMATNNNWFMVICSIIVSVVLFAAFAMFCIKPNLAIFIQTKSASEAITIQYDKLGKAVTGYAEVQPTEHSESAIREIGSIIKDIQTLGDFAIEKWKEQE